MNNPVNSSDNDTPVADERSQSQMSNVNDYSPLSDSHTLEAIKVGNNSVQLLISTQGHLYKARDVECGDQSFQSVGDWSDASVNTLKEMLNSHQSRMSQLRREAPTASAFNGPGRVVNPGSHLSRSGSLPSFESS